jgi:hypothetical protein
MHAKTNASAVAFNTKNVASPWGRDIVIGAKVTSDGRHGAGQPAVTGIVVRIERDSAIVAFGDRNGTQERRRSIRNLRVVS